MKILDAHAAFALRYESGEYEPFADIEYEPIDDELQPLMMVAAASLSGRLGECEDDDDLDAACRHFLTLIESEVFTVEQWQVECMRIFDKLAEFAESYERN